MSKKVHQDHDKGYKELLSHKKTFVELLRSFVKEQWVNDVDEENLELINKSYITPEYLEKEADVIYKVRLKEKDIIFYCLLELQSKVDYRMPLRLLEYMKCLWNDIITNIDNNEMKRKSFRLPAIVPLVLYNGKDNWTAARNFKEILEGYENFENHVLDFNYILFDVNRYSEEELLKASKMISTVFLLDQKMKPTELLERLRNSLGVISKITPEQFTVFKRWLKYIVVARMPDKNKTVIEDIIEKADVKGVDSMISNLANTIEDLQKEAVEKGRAEEKVMIAKEALKSGADIDFVAKITKLDVEVVSKIAKELHDS
jgi:predicted transposase/invertase (TIGR01784 family)